MYSVTGGHLIGYFVGAMVYMTLYVSVDYLYILVRFLCMAMLA